MDSFARQTSRASTGTIASKSSKSSTSSTSPTVLETAPESIRRQSSSNTEDLKHRYAYLKQSVKSGTYSKLGTLHARLLGYK